ncbi:hypothetical protein [Aureibacter tunicatorum]|uniref:Uncharacterized protein n=1 Tax=Aureibacter tunicatorum TaxID=866807 RepID=A0AAE3XTE2_9BACT|nr:hypothetical protein [Aureibacter tunicatorum]MDR6241748.1 hypothetical protein [Aureibacter tunicatorum]BDD07390.1 hypothetical protein AUTU_48730 [Aureibacter tunicatorum]
MREFLPNNPEYRILSRGFGHDATTLIRIDQKGDYKLYYKFQDGELCPLRINLKEYYDLFEMTRGMELWQAFVAESLPENIKRRYNGFFRMMEYLLPEADFSKFSFREEVEQLENKSKTFAQFGFRKKLYKTFNENFNQKVEGLSLSVFGQKSLLQMECVEDERNDTLPDDILAFYMEVGGATISYRIKEKNILISIFPGYRVFGTDILNVLPPRTIIGDDRHLLDFLRYHEWLDKGGSNNKQALGEYWEYQSETLNESSYPELMKINVWAHTESDDPAYPNHFMAWRIVDGKTRMYLIKTDRKYVPDSYKPLDLNCDLPTLFDWMIQTKAYSGWHLNIGNQEFLAQAQAQKALDI